MSHQKNDEFHDWIMDRAIDIAVIYYEKQQEELTEEEIEECYECLVDKYL